MCRAGRCDTEPMLQRQAVQTVCGRICYTLHNFPKQRSLNPLKHTLSCFVPIICGSICVSTSGTFMDTEILLWICSHVCPTLFYSGKTEKKKKSNFNRATIAQHKDLQGLFNCTLLCDCGAANPHVPDPQTTVRWKNCQFFSV